jgi:hypothetical protein
VHPISTPVLAALTAAAAPRPSGPRDRGQATTEYVLVLLGVASIALVVATWAARTGMIGELLDRVFQSISSQIT